MLPRTATLSARALLRHHQRLRETPQGPAFLADLELLQAKDLDFSIRLGALLGLDALLLGAMIQPITASPGATLSLDAARQPIETLVVALSVLLFAASAWLCVRAITLGEEFSDAGIEDNPAALMQRWLAAYCASIDQQCRHIAQAARLTIAAGGASLLALGWILAQKLPA